MSIMYVSQGFLETKFWSFRHVPVVVLLGGVSGQQGDVSERQVGWSQTLSLSTEDVVQEYFLTGLMA